MKKLKAFTLIEVLVVIALVAILAAITFVAINPAKNFADARNAQRSSDVAEILNAITQYTSEQGNSITTLGTIPLCTATPARIGTGTNNINLATTLVEDYIVGIPRDPSGGTDADTGYTICRTANGRVTISAPNAERSKVISVRR